MSGWDQSEILIPVGPDVPIGLIGCRTGRNPMGTSGPTA